MLTSRALRPRPLPIDLEKPISEWTIMNAGILGVYEAGVRCPNLSYDLFAVYGNVAENMYEILKEPLSLQRDLKSTFYRG